MWPHIRHTRGARKKTMKRAGRGTHTRWERWEPWRGSNIVRGHLASASLGLGLDKVSAGCNSVLDVVMGQ
jgi:hypothetical protein